MKIEGQGTAANQSSPSVNEVLKLTSAATTKATSDQGSSAEAAKNPKKHAKEDVELATSVMNEAMRICNYHLEFKVNKDSGRMQVKVIDSESKKVIREIPSDEILECSAKIRALIDHMAGVLVDERV